MIHTDVTRKWVAGTPPTTRRCGRDNSHLLHDDLPAAVKQRRSAGSGLFLAEVVQVIDDLVGGGGECLDLLLRE